MNYKNNILIIYLIIFLIPQALIEANQYKLVNDHNKIYKEILRLKYKSQNSIEEPLVIINPYKLSPLSAYVLFSLENESLIKISINENEKCGINYSFKSYNKKNLIPLVGLKSGYNKVEIIIESKSSEPITLLSISVSKPIIL